MSRYGFLAILLVVSVVCIFASSSLSDAAPQKSTDPSVPTYKDQPPKKIAGELIVNDTDLETGKVERIDCTKFGSGAYSIPSLVENLTFETKAKFILCIETGGMFQRLNNHRFWESAQCIIVEMGGVPTRATRRSARCFSAIPTHSRAARTERCG